MAFVLRGQQGVCPRCSEIFFVCLSCFRLHWYCSTACSKAARSASLKGARKKYSRSKLGRIANRRAQNSYRQSQRLKKNVSHQSSVVPSSALIPTHEGSGQSHVSDKSFAQSIQVEGKANEEKKETRNLLSGKRPICRICKRSITHLRDQGAAWHHQRNTASKGLDHDNYSTNSS